MDDRLTLERKFLMLFPNGNPSILADQDLAAYIQAAMAASNLPGSPWAGTSQGRVQAGLPPFTPEELDYLRNGPAPPAAQAPLDSSARVTRRSAPTEPRAYRETTFDEDAGFETDGAARGEGGWAYAPADLRTGAAPLSPGQRVQASSATSPGAARGSQTSNPYVMVYYGAPGGEERADAGTGEGAGVVTYPEGPQPGDVRSPSQSTTWNPRVSTPAGMPNPTASDYRPGELTLQYLLNLPKPSSWLTPGASYGDIGWQGQPTGRVSYWGETGKPYQLGSQQPSYWYNINDLQWYRGDINKNIEPVNYGSLPWRRGTRPSALGR